MYRKSNNNFDLPTRILALTLCLLLMLPGPVATTAQAAGIARQHGSTTEAPQSIFTNTETDTTAIDTSITQPTDTILNIVTDPDTPYGLDGKKIFNPSPTRAVWLSALLPGLGQIYNRRYWKIPIVIGGFMGLGYATNWNNNQYQDYSQGYRDLLDSDPNTRSYMNFFPPNTVEAELDQSWLQQTLKSRRDFYRRNRDLCIICIVGLYLLCMVDSYVDASLAHFDLSPNLSLDVHPAIYPEPAGRKPAVGVNWTFNF